MNDIYDMPQGQGLVLYGPDAQSRALEIAMKRGIGRIMELTINEYSWFQAARDTLARELDVLIIHGLPVDASQRALLIQTVKNERLVLPGGRVVKTPRVIVCENQPDALTKALGEPWFVVEHCDD